MLSKAIVKIITFLAMMEMTVYLAAKGMIS